MPSRTYFLDASALVHKYSGLTDTESRRVRTRLADLFAMAAKSSKSADLQIPNICMAECAKTFAKFCFDGEVYGDGERAGQAFDRLREALLRDVTRDRVIKSYELKRAHFENIERIFTADYRLPPPRNSGQHLSSHDALIISMATEFANSHHEALNEVVIVTCDRRIAEFAKAYPNDYAAAICVLDRTIV